MTDTSPVIQHKEILLDLVQMYAQSYTSDLCLHQLSVDQWMSYEMAALVTQLRACVLGEDGGVEATHTSSLARKVKPRWLPAFLWDRIYQEYVTIKVSAQPKWTYPSSNLQVPDLRGPVRIAVPLGGSDRVWGSDYGR